MVTQISIQKFTQLGLLQNPALVLFVKTMSKKVVQRLKIFKGDFLRLKGDFCLTGKFCSKNGNYQKKGQSRTVTVPKNSQGDIWFLQFLPAEQIVVDRGNLNQIFLSV